MPPDSRILEGDALQHMAYALTLIERSLERVVQLLPLHHFERVGFPAEQLTHGVLIDGVAFLLEPLDRAALLRDDRGLLDRGNARLNMVCGERDRLRKTHRGLARLGDVKHRD